MDIAIYQENYMKLPFWKSTMDNDQQFRVVQSTSVFYYCKTNHHKRSVAGQKCSEGKYPEALVGLDEGLRSWTGVREQENNRIPRWEALWAEQIVQGLLGNCEDGDPYSERAGKSTKDFQQQGDTI